MIVVYRCGVNGIRPLPVESFSEAAGEDLWLDVYAPSAAERQWLAQRLGAALPSHEAMQEIEPTSRLYRENGNLVMTALVPSRNELGDAAMEVVTFLLGRNLLVSLRYREIEPLHSVPERIRREPELGHDHRSLLLTLLDILVDRLADGLEVCGAQVDALSREVFDPGRLGVRLDYRGVVARIGAVSDRIARARESLFTLDRLVGFLNASIDGMRRRTRPLTRDIQSLIGHAGYLSDKAALVLDGTLGLVGVEQNAIIKIFSVMAVIFLPPTLIASIYGMNFRFMPELDWRLGYPLALLLMVGSAVLPYRWFKRRGWL